MHSQIPLNLNQSPSLTGATASSAYPQSRKDPAQPERIHVLPSFSVPVSKSPALRLGSSRKDTGVYKSAPARPREEKSHGAGRISLKACLSLRSTSSRGAGALDLRAFAGKTDWPAGDAPLAGIASLALPVQAVAKTGDDSLRIPVLSTPMPFFNVYALGEHASASHVWTCVESALTALLAREWIDFTMTWPLVRGRVHANMRVSVDFQVNLFKTPDEAIFIQVTRPSSSGDFSLHARFANVFADALKRHFPRLARRHDKSLDTFVGMPMPMQRMPPMDVDTPLPPIGAADLPPLDDASPPPSRDEMTADCVSTLLSRDSFFEDVRSCAMQLHAICREGTPLQFTGPSGMSLCARLLESVDPTIHTDAHVTFHCVSALVAIVESRETAATFTDPSLAKAFVANARRVADLWRHGPRQGVLSSQQIARVATTLADAVESQLK